MTDEVMTVEQDNYLNDDGGDGGDGDSVGDVNVGSVGDRTSEGLEDLYYQTGNGTVGLMESVSGLVQVTQETRSWQ